MCGIVGVYNFNKKNFVDKSLLKKMCDMLYHRGPDDEGYYVSEKLKVEGENYVQIGLGMRRLAIIDLKTGRQPIYNEDKTVWIVLNGEIYNFLQLKEELQNKGHKFYTHTDTEVIVHLYEEYGTGCVNYLRGMFAFALWDSKTQKLFLARDRIGKKPLYYTYDDGRLIFSSEIKSILVALSKTPRINLNAIDYFLTYQYIPQPITIFDGVYSLLPSQVLVCDKNGEMKFEKYWEISFLEKTNISFKEAQQELKNVLTESVKLRLISDVPLGAFLSGGMDSSIVVGLMSQELSKVKTFSVGFKDIDFSELKYAKLVAEQFSTDHTEIIVEPEVVKILPKLVWYYDQPFADTSMIPSYLISKETRKYVTVALNGDGGDENFCGYLRHKAIKLASMLPYEILGEKFYVTIGNFIPVFSGSSGKKARYLKRFLTALGVPTVKRNIIWHSYFTTEMKNFIYSDFMKLNIKQDAYNYLESTYYNSLAEDEIDKILFTDIKTYLPSDLLVKMDIASMANSLEARSPFLDYKLLEFTAKLPSHWKIRGLKTKYILRETFKNFLPKEILSRPKQGFGLPIGKWLREDLKSYVEEILFSPSAMKREYFDMSKIKLLTEEHFSGKQDHGYKIFALIVLELWHKIFVDKEIKFD
ncbi:MAG: asparagine synthase (glutamine-hydrolyzing) [Endomicrobiia bacterium]